MRDLTDVRAALARIEQTADPAATIGAIDDAVICLFQLRGLLVFDADRGAVAPLRRRRGMAA